MSDSAKFGETFAILDQNNDVIPCGEQKWGTWWFMHGGERRSKFKCDFIDGRLIETCFTGRSRALDGPHLFWLVKFCALPPPPQRRPRSPVAMIVAYSMPIGTPHYQTLEEAFSASPPFVWSRLFGTLAEALACHAQIKKHLKAKERLSKKMPEKTQELLVELDYWCKQKWGRQAQVALLG
jgi:hypothetical protein